MRMRPGTLPYQLLRTINSLLTSLDLPLQQFNLFGKRRHLRLRMHMRSLLRLLLHRGNLRGRWQDLR